MGIRRNFKQTDVGEIPEDWDALKLGAISTQITDGDHLTPIRTRDGYYLLSARNVRDGYLDLSDVDYVGAGEFKRMRQRCSPQSGDILISCSGHGLGRVSLVPEELQCVLVRSAALVKINPEIAVSKFIHHWLRSANAQQQIAVQLSRAAQPNLFINNIEQLLSPVPPTKVEQESIAGALGDADALVDALEQLIAKKRQLKLATMQELLTGQKRLAGFSGKWETKRFEELATPRAERSDPATCGQRNYCIELEHIEQKTGRLLGSSETTDASALKTAFRTGDVLFGKLRAYLRKYWIADRNGLCSTEIWALVPNLDTVTAQYLYQIVTSDEFIEIASVAYGTHMPRSDWSLVRKLEVNVPRVDEQIAIGRLLADMDAQITATELKLAKSRQVKQGMMQELLTGRIRLVTPSSAVSSHAEAQLA